jgi:hypothetical protein
MRIVKDICGGSRQEEIRREIQSEEGSQATARGQGRRVENTRQENQVFGEESQEGRHQAD